jgi:thioredoxin reductase (NADPH)
MPRPLIVVVDADPDSLGLIEGELNARYGHDYEIVCHSSQWSALGELERLRTEGAEVAVLLADQWMAGTTGVVFLSKAGELHPNARRALLIAWGDRTTAEPILRATALGLIHNYIPKPFTTPDEQFHRLVTEFLDAWRQDQGPRFEALQIVGEHWSAHSHKLRDLLDRSGLPFAFHEAGSKEGQELLQHAGGVTRPLPLVVLHDGRVLTDPSMADVAEALGVNVTLDDSESDVIVVGAGPAGLAAAVYGASEGLRVLVVDRETIGGQAGSSSLIPELSGIPAWIERLRARPPRLRAGMAVRDQIPLWSSGFGSAIRTQSATTNAR